MFDIGIYDVFAKLKKEWLIKNSLMKLVIVIGSEKMFKLHSKFEPTGDQPQAIEKLVDGINKELKYQTLLGVTGSRKNIYNGECNRAS